MAQSPGASPGRLTTPVVIGLLAGAGALLAVAGFAGVRRAVEISAPATLVSAMVGLAMFGVLGVLLAVPVFGSIQLLVRELVLGRQASR